MSAVQFESILGSSHSTSTLKNIALILFGSILLTLAAQITIPMQPVPVTLQSAAALFIGMIFGPRTGAKIILAYLMEGALGLPVFANFSCGLPVLFGPTAGYLFGFVPAAFLVGLFLEKGGAKSRCTIFCVALLATIPLFITGYLVLASFIGFEKAYLFGIAPFYSVEICKLLLLTLITPFFWRNREQT